MIVAMFSLPRIGMSLELKSLNCIRAILTVASVGYGRLRSSDSRTRDLMHVFASFCNRAVVVELISRSYNFVAVVVRHLKVHQL